MRSRYGARVSNDGSIGLTPQRTFSGQPAASPSEPLGERPLPTVVANVVSLAEELDPARPVAVVMGNEGSGLTQTTMAGCTHLARLPMAEGADSLNVATALAVALYELTRQR